MMIDVGFASDERPVINDANLSLKNYIYIYIIKLTNSVRKN